jgi:hypothetical protein
MIISPLAEAGIAPMHTIPRLPRNESLTGAMKRSASQILRSCVNEEEFIAESIDEKDAGQQLLCLASFLEHCVVPFA